MKRLAIALALVATVAACTKKEEQKPAMPAAAPADTSHMMADTSKHMMAPDTSKRMGAPATTKAPATARPMQKAPTKAPTKRP